MTRTKLKLFDKNSISDKLELLSLLRAFRTEVYDSDTEVDVDTFIDSHYAIYLIVEDSVMDNCVGFTSFIYNSYFGLREPTVGNSFMYIIPEFRRSNAMHLISLQSGAIVKELNIPLEHCIVDGSGSEKFVGRLKGKKLYTVYTYDVDIVIKEFERLKTKIKIKD